MHYRTPLLLLAASAATAFAAVIPNCDNAKVNGPAGKVHKQGLLVTDITRPQDPHVLDGFQANFFRDACNQGLLGTVTGPRGNNCAKSIPGTKAVALVSQPDGCSVTIYLDEHCSTGATLIQPGQCLQETETGIPSYSIDC